MAGRVTIRNRAPEPRSVYDDAREPARLPDSITRGAKPIPMPEEPMDSMEEWPPKKKRKLSDAELERIKKAIRNMKSPVEPEKRPFSS